MKHYVNTESKDDKNHNKVGEVKQWKKNEGKVFDVTLKSETRYLELLMKNY